LVKRGLLLATVMLAFCLQAVHVVTCAEIDMISTVVSVHDGDTFTLATGDKVRLADLNAPELGEGGSFEARDYLSSLVRQKTVYLDVDDKYRTDSYGRLVCVVYVDYNSTHYLNVNKAMIDGGLAVAKNYDNEFNPGSFVIYLPKELHDPPVAGGPVPSAAFVITLAAVVIVVLIMAMRRR
jgi:micrococcal nuclease